MSEPAAALSPTDANLTPMMRQYGEIKSQHPDAILFYRLGDFYEMFGDDAILASKVLDLTLTTRNKNQPNALPLCGVPYHAAEGYLTKLVAAGHKVVICEQAEDPKQAKGIVRREVTRIVSPGMIFEDQALAGKSGNFLMSLHFENPRFIAAVCDVSTGFLELVRVSSVGELADEIERLSVREVLYSESMRNHAELQSELKSRKSLFHHAISDLFFDHDYASDSLKKYFSVTHLAALGLDQNAELIPALGGLLGYLADSKILQPGLLKQPQQRIHGTGMTLDEATLKNLEVFRTLRDSGERGTLFWHLDECRTVLGSRRLAEWLRAPLMNLPEICDRQGAVSELVASPSLRADLVEALDRIGDLERVANRFVVGSANGRDAAALSQSLERVPQLRAVLDSARSSLLSSLARGLPDLETLTHRLQKTIVDEPPISVKDGGLIRLGVNADLDELREIERSGKDFIARLEQQEKDRTGISSLKIRFNNVFGYYIEITNTNKDKVPDDYIRKQTLSNAERYITPELKDYENKVLGAGERIKTLEYDLFCALREDVRQYVPVIKCAAEVIAIADVLQAFATRAQHDDLVCPEVVEEVVLELTGARHPILERLNPGEAFVPNDITLDQSGCRLMMITGPNMAGKSTVMRMTAVIALMAQIGAFVPCQKAKIGLCDRIFTRVGAHDHLQKGLSTFMVEMVETARILREATARSLVLLDEIGRGTSTFDGLSIAWAVTEDLHDRIGARTLFATHYHELCDLADQKRGIKNYHMAVREWNGSVIFLRQLKAGGTNRSYGVAVAAMAGLPQAVVKRARDVLKLLELKDLSFQSEVTGQAAPQMNLFDTQKESELVHELRGLEINELTPLEALNLISAWKARLS